MGNTEKPEYVYSGSSPNTEYILIAADTFVSQCIEKDLVLSGKEENVYNVKPNNPLLWISANV